MAGVATVSAGGVAGWSTVTARAQNGELPAYADWLTIDDGLALTAVDWATVGPLVAEELEAAEPGEEDLPAEFEADPMIAPVSEGLFETYLSVGLGLAEYGLGRILDEPAEFGTSVEELVETNEAVVLAGDVDVGTLEERLTGEPAAAFVRQLEPVDEVGDATVYAPVDDGDDASIAVSEEAIVAVTDEAVPDPVAAVARPLEAAAGEVDRATEESEPVAWLLETAGDGDAVVGQYDGRLDATFAFDGLEDAEGVVASLSVEDETTSTGQLAAIVDDPDEATLEDVVGASADERELDVEGDRVSATGSWTDEDLATN